MVAECLSRMACGAGLPYNGRSRRLAAALDIPNEEGAKLGKDEAVEGRSVELSWLANDACQSTDFPASKVAVSIARDRPSAELAYR
jgi:hypothetical protein